MKKLLLIIGTIAFGITLMSLTLLNRDNEKPKLLLAANYNSFNQGMIKSVAVKEPRFIDYSMGPRFRPIKRSELEKTTSVKAFFTELELIRIGEFEKLSIDLYEEPNNYIETGHKVVGPDFEKEQLSYLKTMEYSTNFKIDAIVEGIDAVTGESRGKDHFTPHLTVVPEKQAIYLDGMGAFYEYLRKGARKIEKNLDRREMGAAKLYFTVDQNGHLKDLHLKRSSNYPELDDKLIELMNNLPGKWEAAEDQKGKKVEQELVVFFGIMGC